LRLCGCRFNWTSATILGQLSQQIREQYERHGEGGDVLLGLSGGVDSSVVACLLHHSLGSKLKCIMVDTGLLRLNEAAQVKEAFQIHHPELNFTLVDASAKFFEHLKEVQDPEEKRRIIGRIFIEVFNEEAARFKNVKMLAQGTIYPDIVESAATGTSALIKTHHNVGGLPEDMELKLLEPLRYLFKDEVRLLGEYLGLPKDFVWRHPFPGPGLGVRILGDVSRAKADKLRAADAIFIEELRNAGFYEKTSQAFAVLLPCNSVGVRGDARFYDSVMSLRAVVTTDFMTAVSAELPYSLLKLVARRICNEVDGVSRVTYDLTDKPPGTIEWE